MHFGMHICKNYLILKNIKRENLKYFRYFEKQFKEKSAKNKSTSNTRDASLCSQCKNATYRFSHFIVSITQFSVLILEITQS